MDTFDLAEFVRARRKKMGLSQTALAERAGIGRPRVNQLENGQALDMRLGNVVRILEVLNVSLKFKEGLGDRPVFEDIVEEKEHETPGLGE